MTLHFYEFYTICALVILRKTNKEKKVLYVLKKISEFSFKNIEDDQVCFECNKSKSFLNITIKHRSKLLI